MLGGLLVLLLALPAAADQVKPKEKPKEKPKDQSPAQQYQALAQEYQKAYQGWIKAFQAAKSAKAKQKIIEEYQQGTNKFAARFVELARKHPKDPAAIESLVWVVTRASGVGKDSPKSKAFAMLRRDHAKEDRVARLAGMLGDRVGPEGEKFLRAVMEKHPKKVFQAQASLALAKALANSDGATKERTREAEKLLERAAKDYPEMAKQAKGLLFELRHLSVGKKPPEIEGTDQDGKKFKLSDYAGKVVLLDFWGNW
jgi:hypothetical protein